MSAKDLVLGTMAAVRQRVGCDVALYLDDEMLHIAADGVTRYLPVVAVARGGYDPIDETLRDVVSQHFGGLLTIAELRVEEMNRSFGLEPDDAAAVIERSFEA